MGKKNLSLKLYTLQKPQDRKLKLIDEKLMQPVFRGVLLGPTNSGKSTYIKNVLFNGAWKYNKYFDEIYVWIGSLDDLEEMKDLAHEHKLNKKMEFYQTFDNSEIKDLFTEIENDRARINRILFIFDDQACNEITKHTKTNVIDEIWMRGRHLGISCIVSTQKYKILNQNVRQLNLSHLIVFQGVNKTDYEHVLQEHAGQLEEHQFRKIMDSQLQKKYDFIIINYQKELNEGRFQNKNFQYIPVNANANVTSINAKNDTEKNDNGNSDTEKNGISDTEDNGNLDTATQK